MQFRYFSSISFSPRTLIIFSLRFSILFLFLFTVFPSFADYQYNGFTKYQESNKTIDFVCQNKCFLFVAPTLGREYVRFRGKFVGNGVIEYGFLSGEKLLLARNVAIHNDVFDEDILFTDLSFYFQLSPKRELVFIFYGSITGTDVSFDLQYLTFYQKLKQSWSDFWKMEDLILNSINYRYGIRLVGTSILIYGYWLFLIVALLIIFFSSGTKHAKYRKIFFLGITMFLFVGIRNFITYTSIVGRGLSTYTYQSWDNKTFFEIGDYTAFSYKVRKTLKLDTEKKDCKLYLSILHHALHTHYWEYIYPKPCVIVYNKSEADYLLYYKQDIPSGDFDKPILMEFHGSYLLQNNKNSSSPDIETLSGVISTSFTK